MDLQERHGRGRDPGHAGGLAQGRGTGALEFLDDLEAQARQTRVREAVRDAHAVEGEQAAGPLLLSSDVAFVTDPRLDAARDEVRSEEAVLEAA